MTYISRPILWILIVAGGAFQSGGGGARSNSDVLRRGLAGEPTTLDPERAADSYSFEVLRDLYEGLTVETPTGEVAPGGAENWSVSADGLHYTFQLRPSARWSNGEPVVATDYVAGFRRAVDPRLASP